MKKEVYGVVPVSGPILHRHSMLATFRAVPVAIQPTFLFEKAMLATSFIVLIGVMFGLM